MKILYDTQKAHTSSLENRPLLTQAMRDREQKLKEKRHPKTMIRVRFPDRYILEATFYSGSLVSDLFKVVSEHLESPYEAFQLYITPPQTYLDSNTSFWKQKLAPASLVHFAHKSDKGPPYLKHEILSKALDYPVSSPIGTELGLEEEPQPVSEVLDENKPKPSSASTTAPPPNEKLGRPKWFKIGNK